jgi:Cys-tRNA(Pro) deacylase
MSKTTPETLATQALKAAKVAFEGHLYDYEEHGGTKVSAQKLGVDEYSIVKTLIMQNEAKQPLVVLMHGTASVSTKELARQAKVKSVEPCPPEVAQRHSGYLIGGTSPFGTRKRMPVFLEASVAQLPRIWINGGRRGFLVSLDPQELIRVLQPQLVTVALEK